MRYKAKISSILLKFGNIISLSYFSFALILVTFFSNIQFAAKPFLADLNTPFVLVGFIFGFILVLVFIYTDLRSHLEPILTNSNFYSITSIATLIAFIVQQWLIRQSWFITEWDPYTVVQEAFSPGYYDKYYSWYPNNLVITGIFRLIAKLLKTSSFESTYFSLICIGSLAMCISCLLIAFAAKRIFQSICVGYAVFILELLFILASPQYFIPYTDIYGMLAPSVLLFIYSTKLSDMSKAFFIPLIAVLGAFIKPNTIIVLIAIVIVELLKKVSTFSVRQFLHIIPCCLGIFLALQCGTLIKNYTLCSGTISDPELSMTPAHYLMMGWDERGAGGYCQLDVDFSTSILDYDSRISANLGTFQKSLKEMGPLGIIDMTIKKTLSNYSDGMGTWGIEGDYFHQIEGDNTLVKSFYGIGSNLPGVYAYLAQLLWMIILCGIVLQWKTQKNQYGNLVVNLTLLGQSIFLLLFECRARYFVQFWPYFAIAATTGWYSFYKYLKSCHRPKATSRSKTGENRDVYYEIL